MLAKSSKKVIIHSPKLNTILMVERFISDHSGEFKKKSLWQMLPKGVMYQTFCVIFDYLENSGKIARDVEGKIAWIWDPDGVDYFMSQEHLFWSKD